ncbi:TRAP transporter small permease subunit [Chelativorans sp. ZYF759]|uniref:TRAP transporter small permease n=1 Tax=Chelativorans sp. ZYF759 TaxID=2692213 RepID=UPI00145EE8E9|nr:TRAP transporter small permease [Chelativorans sp. ZYF759]NMG41611.1 TRAP transporter small permease subunit [Chelativorans sp. ZYF759]
MTGLGQMTVLWFDRLARLLVWISAAMATVMMLTIFTNVVMRYVFRSPPRGAFEIIEITMGLLVFFALPLMIRQSGNIRVTILFDRFAEPVRRWATFATELLGTAICTFIAWRMWIYGERILRYGEVTMELRIPRGAIAQSMSVLLVVAAVAFLICAVEGLRRAPPPQLGTS